MFLHLVLQIGEKFGVECARPDEISAYALHLGAGPICCVGG